MQSITSFVTVLLCTTICRGAHALDSCSDFPSPGECPQACGTCHYRGQFCADCLPCPSGQPLPAASPTDRKIFSCLYEEKAACNKSCLTPAGTQVGTNATTVSADTVTGGSGTATVSNGTATVSNGTTQRDPREPPSPLVIWVPVGGALFICMFGVTAYVSYCMYRRARKNGGPDFLPFLQQRSATKQPMGLGVCTACDLVVEGTGVSGDGRYCACV